MELNERIAAVRKAAGLTQEQLGELVNVSRQAVSKWESGQAVPDALSPGHPGDPLPALLPPLLKLLSQGAPLPMLLSASSVLSAHLLVPLVIPLFLSRALSASPGPGGYWCG